MTARIIGAAFNVDSRGRRLYRAHKHACGHDGCRCDLEHFAESTACKPCRDALKRTVGRQTNQEITNDQRDADLARLYIAHESSGPGVEW